MKKLAPDAAICWRRQKHSAAPVEVKREINPDLVEQAGSG
jgi:hypothetical protein